MSDDKKDGRNELSFLLLSDLKGFGSNESGPFINFVNGWSTSLIGANIPPSSSCCCLSMASCSGPNGGGGGRVGGIVLGGGGVGRCVIGIGLGLTCENERGKLRYFSTFARNCMDFSTSLFSVLVPCVLLKKFTIPENGFPDGGAYFAFIMECTAYFKLEGSAVGCDCGGGPSPV